MKKKSPKENEGSSYYSSANFKMISERFCLKDETIRAGDARKSLIKVFMDSTVSKYGKLAFLEENRGIILWDAQ